MRYFTRQEAIHLRTGAQEDYHGGGIFSETRYQRWSESQRIADILEEAGYEVRDGFVRFFTMLPGLAVDIDKFKSSCVIPEIANAYYSRHADDLGAWHRMIQPTWQDIGFLTLHACPGRLDWDEVDSDTAKKIMQEAAKKVSEMAAQLRRWGWDEDGYEIILRRTEITLDPMSGTAFPHFHLVISVRRKGRKKTEFVKKIRFLWSKALRKLGQQFPGVFGPVALHEMCDSYVHASRVREIEKVRGYITKPAKIPRDVPPHSVVWLHEVTQGRAQVMRYGSFKRWRSELTKAGGRVVYMGGRYSIICKTKPNDEGVDFGLIDYEAEGEYPGDDVASITCRTRTPIYGAALGDDPDDVFEHPGVVDFESEGVAPPPPGDEEPQGEEAAQELREDRPRGCPPRNLICGITTPRPGPGGYCETYAVVANPVSQSEALHYNDSDREADAWVYEQQLKMQARWEEQNGRPFNEDEYLRPRAQRIVDWSAHPDKRYRSRLKVHPFIVDRCRQLLREEAQAELKKAPTDFLAIFGSTVEREPIQTGTYGFGVHLGSGHDNEEAPAPKVGSDPPF
ncbi:hypothetical protein SAMN04488047_14510 [Tranquillimonas alkanivorans]|uniref:Replication protein n=2 Tax=Tranquillimonas alkanivorans TaxID=441119 RepID=A0A1I5WFJ4_9RHOB|nr:hypothetical protein SAMN04488047_14510 [Tranquillimonas alkanivorans]